MGEALERAKLATWWRIVAAGAGAVVFGFGTLAAIWLLAKPLALLILGITLAASVAPLVSGLERWLPRVVAVVLLYLLGLVLLVGVGALVTRPLIMQAQQFSDRLPGLVAQVERWLDQWNGLSNRDLFGTLSSQAGDLGSYLVSLPVAIASGAVEIALVVFISIYWLVAAPGMRRWVLSLFPEDRGREVDDLLYKMGRAMGGFVRGTVLDSLAVGILTYAGLLVIGVNYALVLGLTSGFLEVIPNLGPIIATVPVVTVAWFQSPSKALIALVFMVVLQQVENHLLLPNIMQSQAELSPLLSILALFAGGSVGGFLGILVSIPLVAALRIFVLEAVVPAVRRRTGASGSA